MNLHPAIPDKGPTIVPRFAPDAFRSYGPHYLIEADGHKFVYAYIRKNACSAFKTMMNQRLHPGYIRDRLLRRNRYPRRHILGNMSYRKVEMRDGAPIEGVPHLFVYRDPLDRFISAYLNKFVYRDGAEDFLRGYAEITGKDPAAATIFDVMAYASHPFSRIDRHLHPQSGHLYEVPYRALDIRTLRADIEPFVGARLAEAHFSKKSNETHSSSGETATDLHRHDAQTLAEMSGKGAVIGKHGFTAAEIADFVHDRYKCDYDLIEGLSDGLNGGAEAAPLEIGRSKPELVL